MLYGMDYDIILPCFSAYYLCIDGDNLLIMKRNSQEFLPISQILSFTLNEPGIFFGHGSVTIKTAQSATGSVSVGHGIALAVGAERVYSFEREYLEDAHRLKDYIIGYNAKRTASSGPSSGKVVSVVDEIRGLKGLLDDGILTQEEFDLQKRNLLDLQTKRSL